MKDLNLSDEQYKTVLSRIYKLIQEGMGLFTDDSDMIGAKHTHCTWGLCTDNVADVWIEPEMHLWPDQFVKYGRNSVKYPKDNHKCPMDMRDKNHSTGCYYNCRIFNEKFKTPTQTEALELYQQQIGRLK